MSASAQADRLLIHRPAVARRWAAAVMLPLSVLTVGALSLASGRFAVPLSDVVHILAGQVLAIDQTWTDSQERVVMLVRLPRVVLGMLVGAGLALCGAVLQAVFRNPLVSPDILGVSAGASFGGALALAFGLGSAGLVMGAGGFGVAALLVVFAVSRVKDGSPALMIVLSGVVVSAFFSALVSLLTYIADPYTELPGIVFWLLGSLATATGGKVALGAVPILAGAAIMLALRWRINVLSLGDDDSRTLAVRPEPLRWLLLGTTAAIVAGTVAVSGGVGWVGLVIPHIARLWVGPDHRVLLPVSLLLGAGYLAGIDLLARTLTPGEIPLGVLTAIVGAPVFFVLLRRSRSRTWVDA